MTENTTTDRDNLIHMSVMAAVSRGYDLIYSELDRLHKRDIHDDDVVKALQAMGETDILEGYVEWAEIILPDAEPTSGPVMDDVVPDPHDAPSYKGLQIVGVQLSAPKLLQFTGDALLELLRPDFPNAYVEQTGGNTATLLVSNGPGDAGIIAVGPGAYDWSDSARSAFDTSDLYYGSWLDDDDAGKPVDPMWTLEELAEKIKAAHAKALEEASK